MGHLLALWALATDQPATFGRLASAYGVYSAVVLAEPPGGGERGLFCTRAVAAGEPLLAVPWQLCLVDEDEPGDDSLESVWEQQSDAAARPARDVRLAAQLLAQLAGDGGDGGGDAAELSRFWREWSAMLPPAAACAHPMTLPDALLEELQHAPLAEAGRRQRRRLLRLLASAPASSDGQRAWATAMCSSRPFRLPARAEGRGGRTAFVPFLDMANHAASPNCEPSEHAAASAMLAWLADTSSDFATSEAQDEATLVGMEGEPAHDPRFAAVVRYRLSRKRLCRLVAEVLEAHRREHLPAAQRP
ncbi:hypothetical protein EMIHUDRAFT_205607 [Emiliania huxleyi CCMP1516]|uniref:SET domain-containing protein n=2 Tax=Emiliania huxleyi TaxID=2903 RepID=A0A0D3JSP3_EMIH1|nr:hypothetical protein EMIHUDRAFT_205607 [Emiliania huxleyi CCMP1516]EOD26528.1 hypothetical protein EMIHUDRAFT_205607 [Emiliania huxleyi CCMP1516]|eukprot:XP_005778957.1 hypothetical protein EMIHUDRAFT_205607 [Emiliania huxleyi CCMP1516]